MNLLANPAEKEVAAAPAPVAAELAADPPERNTLPALLAPPPKPLSTRAAMTISMAMLDPVWATFRPMAAR